MENDKKIARPFGLRFLEVPAPVRVKTGVKAGSNATQPVGGPVAPGPTPEPPPGGGIHTNFISIPLGGTHPDRRPSGAVDREDVSPSLGVRLVSTGFAGPEGLEAFRT